MNQLARYHHQFEVLWSDLDANGHMRHSAFLDFPAQVRVAYFNHHGFSLARMQELRIGPILFSESVNYHREVRDCERLMVDMVLTGLSENRKHWGIRHRLYKADGELAGVLDCRGAWLDLDRRRTRPAPAALHQALEVLQRSDDFQLIISRSASA